MGMSDWRTNILLELFKLTRDGYISNVSDAVSDAVEKVTEKKPLSISQFAEDYVSYFK